MLFDFGGLMPLKKPRLRRKGREIFNRRVLKF